MKMPIVEMLNKYARSNALRLHMPGHKGKGLKMSAKLDVTELSFSDNLTCPHSVIADSQNLFAAEWNANHAIYIVNGSTAGIFAMVANANGSILMQRSSHIAVYNAIKIFNKRAYVINDYDEFLLPNNLTADALTNATKENPDIKTWILTSPSYYGRVLDLADIYHKAKKMGVTVFVDSAHGAHFGLSKYLPNPAHYYADAAVISVHKTLPAYTQTAVLLTNDDILALKLKESLNTFSTTSPSYLLLASIDYARAYADKNKNRYERLFSYVQKFLTALPDGITAISTDDFTRIVLNVSGKNMSGFEAEKQLNEKNVFIEFADKSRLVAILTLMDGRKTLRRFGKALKNLKPETVEPNNENENKKRANGKNVVNGNEIPRFDNIIPLCFNDKVKLIKLSESKGEISAVNAGITPPCCPVIVAGEKITDFHINFLKQDNVFGVNEGYILVKDSEKK